MSRYYICLALLSALGLVGCAQGRPGTVRVLGSVDLDRAYDVGRRTLSEYGFSIAEAYPEQALLITEPRPVEGPAAERLLAGGDTRQVARLQFFLEEQQLQAVLSVEIQRARPAAAGDMMLDTYSGVPSRTPGEQMAATSARQNSQWRRVDFDHALEVDMLDTIYRRLHGPAKETHIETMPAAKPDNNAGQQE